ncbi:MAG: SET domain-containing protein-lysine N-methyltransferase [Spirochaetaceae bacterium]|nr:SET domain-containing protein-lysine N-methyltransferase [Spirochaetaceae bacterium]
MNEKCISGRDEILGFFREKNIVYLKRSRIEWKPLLRKNFYKSPYYKANKPEFLELDKRYGSEIDQCRIAPVYIRKISDSIGYGLFAAVNLAKGEFIGEYTGVIRISEEQTEVFPDGSYETDFSWDYPDDTGSVTLEINGRLEGNELRFVNHHKDYNLDVEHTLHKGQWLIFFIANRDIEANEQLFVSYGDEYWSGGFRQLADLDGDR